MMLILETDKLVVVVSFFMYLRASLRLASAGF